jgi:hypothetical protein
VVRERDFEYPFQRVSCITLLQSFRDGNRRHLGRMKRMECSEDIELFQLIRGNGRVPGMDRDFMIFCRFVGNWPLKYEVENEKYDK